MYTPLVGKTLTLTKAARVVVKNDGQGRLDRLPQGSVITVKAPADANQTMLLADWNGKEILIFELDLEAAAAQNAGRLTE